MKTTWTSRRLSQLARYSGRWWYLPFISFLAFIDLFVVFIPSEGLLISTVLLRPRRWFAASAWMTIGSAFGSIALAWTVQNFGEPILQLLLRDTLNSPDWLKTAAFIDNYGAYAMALIALSPLPQQPAVAICALAHMPLLSIFLAVMAGRAPKYFGFGYTATHAPKLFDKIWMGDKIKIKSSDTDPDAD